MYALIYSATAVKQLKKLPRDMQQRIINVLERCRIRPYPYVSRLVELPYFRLRVGDYRVILQIQDHKLLIFIIEIGHRKNIY